MRSFEGVLDREPHGPPAADRSGGGHRETSRTYPCDGVPRSRLSRAGGGRLRSCCEIDPVRTVTCTGVSPCDARASAGAVSEGDYGSSGKKTS